MIEIKLSKICDSFKYILHPYRPFGVKSVNFVTFYGVL